MKRNLFLCLVVVAVTTITLHAEFYRTEILFSNRYLLSGHQPITLPDGSAPGAGYTAQLLLVGENGSLQPLFPTGAFRTEVPAAEFYVAAFVVMIDSLWFDNGQAATITLRLRVWEGASWETAAIRGESADYLYAVYPLNGPNPPAPPGKPDNFVGFTLTERPVIGKISQESGSRLRIPVVTQFSTDSPSSVIVEASNDLLEWHDLGSFAVTDGAVTLDDSSAGSTAALDSSAPRSSLGTFFRLKLP
jgi:hypothetical protein